MKISGVRIKNFRGYGISENDEGYFVFDDLDKFNIILFSGFNGFGKTSFFDAIEWCLSDKLGRFESVEDILMKSNLNNSSHLKFNGAECLDYAEVEITFDDATTIFRKTRSSSLYFDYSSEVKLNSEIVSQTSLSDYLKNRGVDIKSVIDLNILGQDGINAVLRSKKASDRTKYLSSLVGLGDLNKLYTESKSNKFTEARRKLDLLEKDIQDFKVVSKNIDDSLVRTGKKDLDDLLEYYIQINNQLLISKYNTESVEELTHNSVNKIIKLNDFFYQQISSLSKTRSELIDQINKLKLKKFYNNWKDSKLLSTNLTIIDGYDYKTLTQNIGKWNNQILTHSEKINDYNIILKYLRNARISVQKFLFDDKPSMLKNEDILRTASLNSILHNVKILLKYYKIEYSNQEINYKIDISNLTSDNLLLSLECNDIKEKIDSKKNSIKTMSDLNSDYEKVLNQVLDYINITDEINQCPVCLNSNFDYLENAQIKDDDNTKNQLVSIINLTISGSSKTLLSHTNELIELQVKYSNSLEKYKNKVYDECRNEVDLFNSNFETLYQTLVAEIQKEIKSVESILNDDKSKLKSEDSKMEKFKNAFAATTHEEYDDVSIKKLDAIDRNSIVKKLNQYFSYYQKNISIENEISDIDLSLAEIINLKDKVLLSDKEDVLINNVRHQIKNHDFDFELLDKIKELLLTDVEKKSLENFNILKDMNETKITTKKQTENKFKVQKKVYEKTKALSSLLLENKIRKNPCVLWIYNLINPHPLYRDFEVKDLGVSGTNFIATEDKSVYLDHIFSSAQINVLALSLFLGVGLSQNENSLNQIYMDDPIQSLDDLNLLAYIDLLRLITDSKSNRFGLIISTHDQNFTKLMKIKFRNKSIKIFEYKSYTKLGPIYDTHENGKLA